MSEKKFQINYGNGVTVFPDKTLKLILDGSATLSEIKVLSLVLKATGDISSEDIATKSGLSEQDVFNALAFWRGAGILTLKEEKTKAAPPKKEQPSTSADTDTNKKEGFSPNEEKDFPTDKATRKKALLSAEMPKYSGQEISSLLEKDGGALRAMLDECQQLIGHIFNPRETETLVGLCDWLGVDTAFVITLTAYCTQKKPGCNVSYVQKTALTLANSGIDTLPLLDEYLKHMEVYDGIAGKLRGWLGIGERAFTQKENSTINHWINDLCYAEDVIKLAYDITVERNMTFKFAYANKILENWYKDGVRTLADAEAREEAFKNEKAAENNNKEKSSFSTDEFFDLALKRSYEKMASDKNKD